MSHQNSDADLYLETMTILATSRDPHALDGFGPDVLHAVQANRIAYSRLMLGLAVKLEAGVKPGAAVK